MQCICVSFTDAQIGIAPSLMVVAVPGSDVPTKQGIQARQRSRWKLLVIGCQAGGRHGQALRHQPALGLIPLGHGPSSSRRHSQHSLHGTRLVSVGTTKLAGSSLASTQAAKALALQPGTASYPCTPACSHAARLQLKSIGVSHASRFCLSVHTFSAGFQAALSMVVSNLLLSFAHVSWHLCKRRSIHHSLALAHNGMV